MDADLGYLLTFLEEEFKNTKSVRIRSLPRAGKRRSPDLPQDYDAESGHIHRMSGVIVSAFGKEYLFPVEWISERRFDEIQKQINEITQKLE